MLRDHWGGRGYSEEGSGDWGDRGSGDEAVMALEPDAAAVIPRVKK